MSRRCRAVVSIGAALVVGAALSGCGTNPKGDSDRLRAAIRRTETPSHSFIYKEATAARHVSVRGVQADDYRYKARVVIDGVDVEDEVASDDAIAVRFVEPSGVDLFLAASGVAAADAPTALQAAGLPGSVPTPVASGAEAIANLRARRWVTDPIGAPELTAAAQKRRLGDDPVLDALTVLSYVEASMGEAESVKRFNPEALDYIAREDKFPKPDKKSGVSRFDLKPRRIVRPSQGTPGGGLPEAVNFRRMSVYVKDGLVIKVLEDVDVLSRIDRLISAYAIKLPSGLSPAEAAAQAMAGVNRQRKLQGADPIRVRQMSLELLDSGKVESVDLPSDTIEADLSLLRNRGRAANTAGAQAKVTTSGP